MTGPLILTVDHNRRNLELLAQFLGQAGYGTLKVSSLPELDQALAQAPAIRLALIDIGGFDRSVWDRCQQLGEWGIPLLVISPRDSSSIREDGISHGAQSVLTKPLVAKELIRMIRSLIEE